MPVVIRDEGRLKADPLDTGRRRLSQSRHFKSQCPARAYADDLGFVGVPVMPRGACEICGERDAFVYAVPIDGSIALVCPRCLNFPQAGDDADDDEGDERDRPRQALLAPGDLDA